MTCIAPPPIDEDSISMVLDGTADAAIVDHIAACDHCRARVEEAARTETMLRLTLDRFACPPPAALRDYHFELLDPSAHDEVAEHLALCSSCTAELTQMENFIARGQVTPSETRSTARLKPGELLREVIASLLPTGQPAYALRGETATPLMAQAEDVTLFIELQQSGAGYTLNGQVTAADMGAWTGAFVQIMREGELIAAARVDDSGIFSTTPVEPEPLTLRITSEGGRVIVLPDLDPTS